MNPMDAAWRVLKARQTELGEFHEDFPSSHGPVTGYRAVSDEQHRKIPQEGLKVSDKPWMRRPPSVWAYMSHDEEGREKAKAQAQAYADPRPGASVVGIRGSNLDLPESSKDILQDGRQVAGRSTGEPWLFDDWASFGPYGIPQDIPPEMVVS
jgi:hypothetical protein